MVGYAGQYHVRYFYDSGEFSDEYDLIIGRTGDAYKVLVVRLLTTSATLIFSE